MTISSFIRSSRSDAEWQKKRMNSCVHLINRDDTALIKRHHQKWKYLYKGSGAVAFEHPRHLDVQPRMFEHQEGAVLPILESHPFDPDIDPTHLFVETRENSGLIL